MKKLALLLPLLSLNCIAEESDQDKNYSVGLGMGAMYSGIGTNFSLVSENDLKYISAGCTEYSSATKASCGFGIGWIKTDLFGSKSNKHGLGIYATLIGTLSKGPTKSQTRANRGQPGPAGSSQGQLGPTRAKGTQPGPTKPVPAPTKLMM